VAVLPLSQQHLQHRQHIAERLAARRSRHDDDVLAPAHSVERLGLVCVEALDAAASERLL